jgi:hypothetical protein
MSFTNGALMKLRTFSRADSWRGLPLVTSDEVPFDEAGKTKILLSRTGERSRGRRIVSAGRSERGHTKSLGSLHGHQSQGDGIHRMACRIFRQRPAAEAA